MPKEVTGMVGAIVGGFFFVVAALYFAPSIVAVLRHVPNTASVFVINLFLGWSFIGWVVALAMAVRSNPSKR